MTRPNSFTLSQRLYATSAVIMLAMIGLAATVWLMMRHVSEDANYLRDHRVPQLLRIAEIELNVTRASLQLRHAILARTPEEMNTALADVAERKRLLQERLGEFGKGISTDAGRQAFAQLPDLMQNFWAVGTENVKLIQEGKKAEAFAFLTDNTVPARNKLLNPLAAEKLRQGKALDTDVATIQDDALRARNIVMVGVLFVCLGLAGFIAYMVAVLKQLGGEPAELKQVADAVAAGNLAEPIPLRSGDTTSIMAALRTMRDKLAETVRTVRENADSVATASAQIAIGNADLSGRTEQQANALQETAASMEQLGATVRQNADNARQANQLAEGSSQVAMQGGEMVREVVATMRGINESSRKIADIIGTIDGIAFQTNILALNAAVEAARAGEQGRGFAVVASEVRSLAQRSAEAAREIKALIGASVTRVEQGTLQVDRAGATMQEIVSSIRRVTDIVAEISSASSEQNQGVSQVGAAVTQMDRATQQNAALVEESAAAADSLKQQAQALVHAVSAFRMA
jgi:methyl-accepting chemotaxis protein